MGDRQQVPAKSDSWRQPKVLPQQGWERDIGVSFPSVSDQLCSGPRERAEILIKEVKKYTQTTFSASARAEVGTRAQPRRAARE